MNDQAVTGLTTVPAIPPAPQAFRGSAEAATLEGMTLNQPSMNFAAGKVRIEALVDLDGLAQLASSLADLRVLMQPKSADDLAAERAKRAVRPDPFAWR